MLGPFATLAFLTVLWLAAKWMLDLADDDGGRIASALAGRSMLAMPPEVRPVSGRFQPRAAPARRPIHAQPEWRAAA